MTKPQLPEISFSVEGSLTQDDLRELNCIRMRNIIRLPYRFILWFMLATFTFSWVGAIFVWLYLDHLSTLNLFIICSIPATLIYIHRYFKSMKIRYSPDNLQSPSTLTFSHQIISCLSDSHGISNATDDVTMVFFSSQHIYIEVNQTLYYAFPKRFFPDQQTWQQFQLTLYRRFGNCTACDYCFLGSTTDTCPECGSDLLKQINKLSTQ
ncbi:hypothetical protein KS4_32400 [Poriferisphaera corsica]|uniref:YcxB-like protein domain-containing protein n=1 Tax=Poriferisphaera corsica TaxID=2528020 RepID=A0A517YY49_9BACT|nr:hypothetical protein [Poriferisphaera corsica]QDU35160.1 hypothetical protein KS4_32400 [Poriferisphaera corsica]